MTYMLLDTRTMILAQRNGLTVRLATTAEDSRAAQRLRFKVFYEELSAQPDAKAAATRMDVDRFDSFCDHLLVIEEAHSMPDATLKHLKRLHEMRNGRRPLLGILLIAQTELKDRLAQGLRDGHLREVAQRCEVVQLLPLDNDLAAYLKCRAAAAGVDLATLVNQSGIDALRKRLTLRSRDGRGSAVSMCYPLAVNNMLTKALNKAAEAGAPIVDEAVLALV